MDALKTPVILDEDTKQHRPIKPGEHINAEHIAISKLPGNRLQVIEGALYASACGDEADQGGVDGGE